MLFKTRTDWSWSEWFDLNRLVKKKTRGRELLSPRGRLILTGVFLLAVGGVPFAVRGTVEWLPLIMAPFVLLWGIFFDHLIAWSSKRNIEKKVGASVFSFDEDGFSEETRAVTTRRAYAEICDICQCKDYFLLFLDEANFYIIKKNSFMIGDPEQFKPFIEEKTGRQVKEEL